jgi:hypothetical protein
MRGDSRGLRQRSHRLEHLLVHTAVECPGDRDVRLAGESRSKDVAASLQKDARGDPKFCGSLANRVHRLFVEFDQRHSESVRVKGGLSTEEERWQIRRCRPLAPEITAERGFIVGPSKHFVTPLGIVRVLERVIELAFGAIESAQLAKENDKGLSVGADARNRQYEQMLVRALGSDGDPQKWALLDVELYPPLRCEDLLEGRRTLDYLEPERGLRENEL